MASLGLMRAFPDDAQESLTHLEGMGSVRHSPGRNLGEFSPLGSVDLNCDVLQVASTFTYENLQKPCLLYLLPFHLHLSLLAVWLSRCILW